LDHLLETSDSNNLRVVFEYAGYVITVDVTGNIECCENDNDGD
jgi:hypothetical protein